MEFGTLKSAKSFKKIVITLLRIYYKTDHTSDRSIPMISEGILYENDWIIIVPLK